MSEVSTTRKSRLVRFAGATAAAGLIAGGLAFAAAPANAATATNLPPASHSIQLLPGCILPAGATWQGHNTPIMVFNPRRNTVVTGGQSWEVTLNGVDYFGTVYSGKTVIPPDQAVAEGYPPYCEYLLA